MPGAFVRNVPQVRRSACQVKTSGAPYSAQPLCGRLERASRELEHRPLAAAGELHRTEQIVQRGRYLQPDRARLAGLCTRALQVDLAYAAAVVIERLQVDLSTSASAPGRAHRTGSSRALHRTARRVDEGSKTE
jgi:hypothetical protein